MPKLESKRILVLFILLILSLVFLFLTVKPKQEPLLNLNAVDFGNRSEQKMELKQAKEIATQTFQAWFASRSWNNGAQIAPNDITVTEETSPIISTVIKRHHIFYTSSTYPLDDLGVFIVVSNTGGAFWFPDGFNQMIEKEQLVVDTKQKALLIAQLYFELAGEGQKVINSLKETNLSKEDMRDLKIKSTIHPPSVNEKKEGYHITLFTWHVMFMDLEKWFMEVNEHGFVTLLKRDSLTESLEI